MKILTIIFMLLAGGCANRPVSLSGVPAEAEVPVFATIADANDPIDMAAAPVVNRLALYTHNVAQILRKGTISKQYAIDCRERERKLRYELEDAIRKKDLDAIRSASNTLDGYINELERYR